MELVSTLVKASSPEIDRMEGGKRRWIPDPPTFNCMGLNWSAVKTIADSEWNQVPQGAPYPSRAGGTLLQGSGPRVYVMTGCQRHWIPDPETFNALGYNWSAIRRVTDVDLTAIPEGAPLSTKTQQELDMLKQQEVMKQQQDAIEMQSNIISKSAETQQKIIDNMS